jgi:hypothetical protein
MPMDAVGQSNPGAVLSSLSPSLVPVGVRDTTVTVQGTGFAANSIVFVNGNSVPTTFESNTQLAFVAPSGMLASPAILVVTVYTPGTNPSLSFLSLTVASLKAPQISSITPPSVRPGQTSTVRIAGTDLLGGTLVLKKPSDGSAAPAILTVARIDSTPSLLNLSLTLPANYPVGTYNLSLSTPAGVSSTVLFTVANGGSWSSPTPGGGTAATQLLDGRVFLSSGSSILLADGRVLVVGGGASAAIYDPAADRSNTLGFLSNPYRQPQLVLLPNGKVLIAESTYEIIDPQTGISTAITPIPVVDPTPPGRIDLTGPNSNFKAVVLGTGQILFMSSQSFQIYDPKTGTFTQAGGGAGIPYNQTNNGGVDLDSVVRLLDGRLLATFFQSFTPGYTYTVYSRLYDPNTGQWTPTTAGPAGSMISLLDGTVLSAGEVYSFCNGSGSVNSHTYDPSTGAWNLAGSMIYGACRPALTLLNDGRVLAVGGGWTQYFTYNFTSPVPNVGSISTFYSDANVKTLMISGTGFLPNSSVRLGNKNLVTTFISSKQLMAFIPSSSFLNANTDALSVVNPPSSSGSSNKTVTAGDFDGDGKSDLSVFRPFTGTWWIEQSGPNYTTYSATQWGLPGDIPVTGDYDGDRKADIAVYRPSSGTWWILPSTAISGYLEYQWGIPGDVPVVGDYDGDGKTDIAVYRPSDGTWWILRSTASYSKFAYLSYQWGMPGDIAAPGDYDGDGKTDIAVYRPSTGTWWILQSSTNFSTYVTYQWGMNGDIPVARDFDGDGATDIAVYRPSDGTWWILLSSANFSRSAYQFYQWGMPGDMPVLGDFDGDGKADIAVYRPSTGTWWILQSKTNFMNYVTHDWGMPGDVPVLQP